MQNYCKTIGALAAATAFAAAPANAEIEYDLSAGYHSDYIFRGINLGSDLTDVAVGAATEKYGLSISGGLWYGSTQQVSGTTTSFDELDVFAEVSKDFDFATVGLGYIFYHFPDSAGSVDDAQEIYLSVSKDLGPISTTLAYYWDTETDNDGYTQLSGDYSKELSSCVTLNVGGVLGYLVEEGDLSHFQTTVSLDWAISDTATLSPYIAHVWTLSEGGTVAGGAAGDSTALYGGQENEFFGGLGLSVSF